MPGDKSWLAMLMVTGIALAGVPGCDGLISKGGSEAGPPGAGDGGAWPDRRLSDGGAVADAKVTDAKVAGTDKGAPPAPSCPSGAAVASSWVWPVTGTTALGSWSVTNPLGNSWSSYYGHLGEDYGMGSNYGKPVHAVADGKVIEVDKGIGNYLDIIIVEHCLPQPTSGGDTILFARYGHTLATVTTGQLVKKGDQLGTLGNPTPFAPHLHMELVNRIALEQGPFCNGCQSIKVHMSPGYAGYTFSTGADSFHDKKDAVTGNRFYKPSLAITSNGKL